MDVGLAIIPGVITICTLVMMLTNGASAAELTPVPLMKESLSFHGLERSLNSSYHRFLDSQMHPESPFRSRHSVLPVPQSDWYRTWQKPEPSSPIDVAVFTAMCMCWSGYLSIHVAMMSSLKVNKLTGKAILSHTIGGLCAGVVANWIFKLVMLFL